MPSNPFSITYGSRLLGGSSTTYLLNGPYTIDKSFEEIRVVANVIVTAGSYSAFQSACDDLETDLRKRDQNLTISLSGNDWTYTAGSNFLNPKATCSKTGDEQTDRGFSRSYNVVITGELPADDQSAAAGTETGLRDIQFNVDYTPSRQRIVTIQGAYTRTSSPARSASANYLHANGGDIEASTFLDAVSSASSYELVDENYTPDRTDANCEFTRQYVELLFNQTTGTLNDTTITDHRVVFTDLSQHPGDSKESIYRLRRVRCSFECGIDVDQSTDLQAAYSSKIKDYIKSVFQANFNPSEFAIEDQTLAYDETQKRLSASVQFIYRKYGGEPIIEVSESLAYREQRHIDYTPLHRQSEFAYTVDPGWAIRERVISRTVTVMGKEEPKARLGVVEKVGPAGPLEGVQSQPTVSKSGWNIVSNTSQAVRRYIGDPDQGAQLEITILTEEVIERYNEEPGPRRSLTGGGR